MSNEKMMEEFEAWAVEKRLPLHKDGVVVTYAARATDDAWQAWQASRAAIEVEIPPVRPEPSSSGDDLKADGEAASWNIWVGEKLAKAECREAIQALGLKVKP